MRQWLTTGKIFDQERQCNSGICYKALLLITLCNFCNKILKINLELLND